MVFDDNKITLQEQSVHPQPANQYKNEDRKEEEIEAEVKLKKKKGKNKK